MKLEDAVLFRKDLLFQGAVQLGWFERNQELSDKAAAHFIFHGPDYHGVTSEEIYDSSTQLMDTASFTQEITARLTGRITDDPFLLAIAGYGTGKSHLALTLSTLFSRPRSKISKKILDNLMLADAEIGKKVIEDLLSLNGQEFLVITLNGMEDFNLGNQISQQILRTLRDKGIDTSLLEDLRPRFKLARRFTESFHSSLQEDFQRYFGTGYRVEEIIESLQAQDEDVFEKVNEIYTRKMGSSFLASGLESLQDFIRIAKGAYCGPEKPFAGIIIFFDEFGRYLEFAVQKPFIAGPAALQQLFEAVQENGDKVFLISFIQSDLKAYISRVGPERRDEINRYVTRFDVVRKVRLSTNLETVIASLLEKKNVEAIDECIAALDIPIGEVRSLMVRWFPEIQGNALWVDPQRFYKIVGQGCWPLHPLSTWVLYKLTAIGKSLQQRSALSILADIFESYRNVELKDVNCLMPIELLSEGLLAEFYASERIGEQRAVAHAYQNVIQKYMFELDNTKKALLKAILLQTKIGIKVESKDDYLQAVSMFSGLNTNDVQIEINILEKEFGVLEWNGLLCQYEIIGDAVPRKTFLDRLAVKVEAIDIEKRGQFFSANFKQWSQLEEFNTDFGEEAQIFTKEWNYNIHFSNVSLLDNQIEFALREWCEAINVDTNKGQLIYCYVGSESQLEYVMEKARVAIKEQMDKLNLDWEKGAPLAIIFLNDSDGTFGYKLAEYWVLEKGLNDEEVKKYANFIQDKKDSTWQEISNQFSEMEKERNIIFATDESIPKQRLKKILGQLFDVVYPERIPFPFDGFSTARGNAAKDSQNFTKELILGNLDRDWLQARSKQQQNRGYAVFDKSWGIFDNDGSVRLLPVNPKVRNVVKMLDSMLEGAIGIEADSRGVTIGKLIRLWCAPPYGINLAAAGLLLGFFIGRRREALELYKDNEIIAIESWLADAMPGNFFELSVLDKTEIVRISEERVSEWEALLDEWELEPTYEGKVAFLRKAEELETRIPIPQHLYYKLRLLKDDANKARIELRNLDNVLNDALEKIERGKEKEDVSRISWGAADLAEKYMSMTAMGKCWSDEQIKEVEGYYTTARLLVKQLFPRWLVKQKETNIERISKFKFILNERVGANLEILGLEEEKEQLKAHVDDVVQNVHQLEEIKESTSAVDKLVEQNNVSDATTVRELKAWLEQVELLRERLRAAWQRTDMGKDELTEAFKKLNQFEKECNEQLNLHNSRAVELYNQRTITCLSDIIAWKNEVINISRIFAGQEKDLEDFNQVLRQLEMFEEHYNLLSREDLSETELASLLQHCRGKMDELFAIDTPPLDSELFYESIMDDISNKRKQIAAEWLERNLPKKGEIQSSGANRVVEIKRRLEKMPPVLSSVQEELVRSKIEECERRLDELQVEGLFAQFSALSDKNKRMFLKKLTAYCQDYITFNNKQSESV